MNELKFAIVFGWGAVEKTAENWHPQATVEEIEPRLWEVKGDGIVIGYIGKEGRTVESLQRAAELLRQKA